MLCPSGRAHMGELDAAKTFRLERGLWHAPMLGLMKGDSHAAWHQDHQRLHSHHVGCARFFPCDAAGAKYGKPGLVR